MVPGGEKGILSGCVHFNEDRHAAVVPGQHRTRVSAQPLLQPKPRRFGDHQNTIIGKFVFCRGAGGVWGLVAFGVALAGTVGRWGSLSLCNRRSQRAEGEGGSRCLFHVFHFYLGPW